MHRLWSIVVVLLAIRMAIAGGALPDQRDDAIATFTKQYCLDCHAGSESENDVVLSGINLDVLKKSASQTRLLMHVLESCEMPPEDSQQPTPEERSQLLKLLEPVLHEAVARAPYQERTSIRRMNRFQYNNAVVDLFQLKCVVFTLPERAMRIHNNYFKPDTGKMPDTVTVGNRPLGKSQMIEPRLEGVAAFPRDLRAEHGYDNQGDHLSLSPLLMDEFLKVAQSITGSKDFNKKHVGIWNDFFVAPKEGADIQQVLEERLRPFLSIAFRRFVEQAVVDRYVRFTLSRLEHGQRFEEAMKSVASAIISSPRFLYLYEQRGEEDAGVKTVARGVDDFELASRLSFFLWGSLPDEQLLEVASRGALHQTEVLSEQIQRLLRDKKIKRFCDSFALQWLQLDRIISSVPNRDKFPSFYFSKYRASMHMMMEPLLLFETVLIEDLPITELIAPSFTYQSAFLQKAYGVLSEGTEKLTGGSGVTTLTFHRVPIMDLRMGGIITNAAVMTMTSGPERTQPVTRGAWVAGVVFNDPPEPPPADVPPLPAKPADGQEHLTVRDRLALHRDRADCRVCHEQIDPLGFALENYDAIGRWRDVYDNGLPIDATGRIFRHYDFSNVVEFKEALLANSERFSRALAGHLMSFALGRTLEPADDIALKQIVEKVSGENNTMQAMIREVILSTSFQGK